MEEVFYNIPDDTKKIMSYVATLQTSSQAESACNATSKCMKVTTIMSLLRDMKLMSRDRIFVVARQKC